ncbi:HAD-IB family hydrolase/lysophospholipid acyltransferase family protein [Mycolicibacterium sp.]|uniref:HAD-IB family hydrolase/lysophospholipid acyltransferase family protein n=1 Tax=Mycolicibacterium sp. TaxID=2320850 RepID=UPI0025DBF973|nr:HAD-IB family hydrolase/lysophospholipid acyltransferase family protein [Mycolicibacterium sp.]MCB9409230.1 HAD-IB family hydrolase [Mycolicibacterium sp.]
MSDTTAKGAAELRLPGSVAEVMASPAGPQVGAFFDVDGTLVAGFTGVILTRERFRSRDMGVGELISMVAAGLNHQFGRMEFEELINKATDVLRGRPLSDLQQIGQRLFSEKIEKRIYPEMRDLVQAHIERGHTVVLSSSALTIQVEPVARFLGIPNVLTNQFETDQDGVLTGKVVTPILWGPGKANAVQKFAADHDIDLKQSYFYADGDEDLALMHLVGNPRPTNPGEKMAEVARKRGWPILRFSSRGRGGLIGQVRTLLGVGSIVPAAYGAIGWGLLTFNRRRGVNFFTTAFPQMLLALNGVRLNILGEENLKKQRPAVFIFNHRNNFDPVLVASMVKDNWTGVGKKELENDPVVGTLGKLVDTIFIDREDPKKAVESLKQAEELTKKGLSVVIAPEGTRLDTRAVGQFKKGPFRLAMSAGVPIVPIVIRNAEQISARDSSTLHPGTVDVVVYPPISLQDWTLDNLSDRIAEVRQLYIDTLKNWPLDKVPAAAIYRRTPAKKAAPKKVPAKKAAARKAPAKKAAAKKAPAKKAAAKKVPVKKAAAKKAPVKKAAETTTQKKSQTRVRGRR